jgi:L,D-transpeptidase YcbB
MRVMLKIPRKRAWFFALGGAVLAFLAFVVWSFLRPSPAAPRHSPLELTQAALRARVGGSGASGPVFCRRDLLCGSDVLPDYYRKRDFRPGWIDDRLELAKARAFLSALASVVEDGLDPANYHRDAIAALLAAVDQAAKKGPSHVRSEDLVDLEMLLTDGFLLCGSHLVHGQVDPATLHSDWYVKGRIEDLAAVLDKGLDSGDISGALDSLRPGFPVYRQLRTLYGEFAKRAASGGWPAFPAGPKLAKGGRGPRIADLRRTLAALGDLPAGPAPADPDLLDETVAAAVRSFQARHGLEPDGVVGPGTVAALNVSASGRLMQIKANLERWRWVTQDLGDRYVIVNIASFFVWVVEAGRPVLSTAAIVGRAYRQTPDFSSRITRVTINPPWNVPTVVAREDLLPLIQKDPGYLRKMGFRIFASWAEGAPEIDPATVDWSRKTADDLAYKFVQNPGPQNALGRLSFTFPNEFAVFMHDTPGRGLFLQAGRALSSGCVRLEKALDLAVYLLRDDPDWTEDRIAAAIETGETQEIRVRAPLNVHVLYWTGWLGDDGRPQFREDIYLRDAALVKALQERAAGAAR